MTIKVIKDLPKWEVMRRHEEEGARWAYYHYPDVEKDAPGVWSDGVEFGDLALCIATGYRVAIIDDSNPVIEWDKFDWEFFNQYGGLPTYDSSLSKPWPVRHKGKNVSACFKLDESPWYPWFGGDCPVPENVEVEIECADGFVNDAHGDIERTRETTLARDVEWNYDRVIAFRLTGRVL